MQRALMLCAVVAVALSTAGAATAGDGLGAKVASLQRQVNAQQKQIAALTSAVNSLKAQSGAGVSGQVSALQSTVTSLQGNLNTLGALVTCRVANLYTIDYGFFDIIAMMLGQPTQFTGQVASDNGTCAQVGLSPPSPAPDIFANGSSPAALDMAMDARLLHLSTR